MKLLIIEDNDLKYDLIEDCILDKEFVLKQPKPFSIERAASYQSAIIALLRAQFDRVILDMTLPVYDGKHSLVSVDMLPFGGQLVLREMKRKNVDAKFIVLSQYGSFVDKGKEVTFEELREQLTNEYPGYILGCVKLDKTSVEWKFELYSLLGGDK